MQPLYMPLKWILAPVKPYVPRLIVEWLWATKLKSRNSFLLILQFIDLDTDVSLHVLQRMLALLNHRGYIFFLAYVKTCLIIHDQVAHTDVKTCEFQEFMRSSVFAVYTARTLAYLTMAIPYAEVTCNLVIREYAARYAGHPHLARQRHNVHRGLLEAQAAMQLLCEPYDNIPLQVGWQRGRLW